MVLVQCVHFLAALYIYTHILLLYYTNFILYIDFIKKLLSGSGEGEIKRLNVIVRKVEALEERYKAMSDDELRGQTALFKERVKKGESLDDLLPEAFAVVREGAWRSVGMRHFPVQILGGIVLHQGRIAEMKTGEGKTLGATLPA